MRRPSKHNSILLELGFLLVFVGVYLIFFNVTIPHGDALRISRQIAANQLIWNPNHLLLDTFGYLWIKAIQLTGADVTVLSGFELISAITTLISIIIFHRILILLDVKVAWVRVLVIIGLFSSKNFLSMAVSQYFFMLQMPFLLAAVYCGIRFHDKTRTDHGGSAWLYVMGLCMAIAAGIEINNIVPVFFVGIALAFTSPGLKPLSYVHTFQFWSAAAGLGLPIFITGYLLSNTGSDFLSWLLAYQGEAESSLDAYYGTPMSLAGVVSSGATLLFHLFFGNMVETAGLGTILKVVMLQQPLEFVPDTGKIILAGFLMPVIGVGLLLLFGWAFRYGRSIFLVRLSLSWIGAYLFFNFFWPYTADLFWFQLLPFIWLLFVAYLGARGQWSVPEPAKRLWTKGVLALASVTVICLLVLNTSQTVIPLALADIDNSAIKHQALLREGDLEIVPGWDNYKWMMRQGTDRSTTKLLLMNMALEPEGSERHISKLPEIVRTHLQARHRVIVGRLYDLDRESNPWYGLAELGWPRKAIQIMLEDYCNQRLDTIDDVGFHELFICDQGADRSEPSMGSSPSTSHNGEGTTQRTRRVDLISEG